ncbi:MAG: lysophospholipid acyltransferase family protein [Chthoniobacterales bacterium]
MKIEGRSARWLTALGYRVLQLWAATLRFEVDDRSGLVGQPRGEPFITAIWHNRLLLWAYAARRYLSNYEGTGLTSASRDGELIAGLVERHGYEVVRGSTSRRGLRALLELKAALARGRFVGIIPDGPRGPAYKLAAGIIVLAQRSGAPILPMHMEFSSCWRLKNWDRFILPRPFSTVRLLISPLYRVNATADETEFESERLRLENTMMEMVETR